MAKTPTDIRSLARSHTKTALNVLAKIMQKEDAPEASRVAAANALLDRGWGKPVQAHQALDEDGAPTSFVVMMPAATEDPEQWRTQHKPNGQTIQ